jgi:hypothetical protein
MDFTAFRGGYIGNLGETYMYVLYLGFNHTSFTFA